MISKISFIALVAIVLMVQFASASIHPEFIIITDSSITAESALNQAVNGAQSNLRRAVTPQLKKVVDVADGSDNNSQDSELSRKAKSSRQYGLTFALTSEDQNALRAIPGVVDVVPNSPIELAIVETSILDVDMRPIHSYRRTDAAAAAPASQNTTEWNLDRVDQVFGRDGLYTPALETGTNVDMYIIDTGVMGTHVAFGGRVQPGTNALVTGDTPGNDDCHGHGTHVAGTAAGDMFGIARGALIFPVKILDCNGQGSLMGMVTGVSWVTNMIASRGPSRKPVVNLSIQAGASDVIDNLVKTLYSAGAVVVVAAANFNADACNYSPAREPVAVTVGATSDDDSKLSSSNFGSCVDLFAPGDNIVSAGIYSTTATAVKRGTSMASPIVAGIVATLRQKFPQSTNAQIVQALLNQAKPLGKNVMDMDCSGTLQGVKFAQTISAGSRNIGLNDPVVLANGSILQGEFLNWAPELSVKPVNGEICVSFGARVLNSRAPVSAASIRVAFATAAIPDGLVNFIETSMSCKDLTTRWWAFDSVGEDTRRMTSKIWDFQGNVIGAVPRQAIAQITPSGKTQFYVSLKASDQGLTMELGSGDGQSDRTRFTLVNAVDGNFKSALDMITVMSFSSNSNYDIMYTDVQPCSGVQQVIPTQSPTTVAAGGGGVAPPTQLTIPRAKRNKFFFWPAGWSKPSLSTGSCFQFRYPISKAGKIFVGLATQALGLLPVTGVPRNGSRAHVLAVTRNTVQLYRDGNLINQQYIVPAISLPKKGATMIILRAEAQQDGTISLDMQTTDTTWTNLYQYTDPLAGFLGTRFSLGSTIVRSFSNIAVCSN